MWNIGISLLLFSFIYFFPAIVAYNRHKANTVAIFAANLFFGVTVIGWFICLVWALLKDDARSTVRN